MPESFVHYGVKIEHRGKQWRWRARSHGRIVSCSSPTFEQARDRLEDFLAEREQERNRSAIESCESLTVGELCDRWFVYKRSRIAPATAQQYGIHIRVHVRPGLGLADANRVMPRDLEDFYTSLRWKSAKESHNILRQAFEWGIRNELLVRRSNPCLVVRPSRRACVDHDGAFGDSDAVGLVQEKDIPRRSDVKKLLLDAEELEAWTWWLYLKVAATTGARPGEVCALRRKNFDFSRGLVVIEWSADRVSGRLKRPKTSWSIRTLVLPAELLVAIEAVMPANADSFLFPSNTQPGARSPLPCWNSRSVKRRLDAAITRAGLPHYTPHAFRHYVATHLLDEGWPSLQVARFLGHADDTLVRRLYGNHIVDQTQRLIGEAASRLA